MKAACLCCVGWFDVLCITMSVVVGFLYILYVCVLLVLLIVRSRKFILLFCSISSINFNLWCIVSVSYTHLDVYKRQTMYCSQFAITRINEITFIKSGFALYRSLLTTEQYHGIT